jgi:hypothetical protein
MVLRFIFESHDIEVYYSVTESEAFERACVNFIRHP